MASSDSSDYLLERLRGLVMRTLVVENPGALADRWDCEPLDLKRRISLSAAALYLDCIALRFGLSPVSCHRAGGFVWGSRWPSWSEKVAIFCLAYPTSERQRLQRLHHHIEQQGQRHPLWKALRGHNS